MTGDPQTIDGITFGHDDGAEGAAVLIVADGKLIAAHMMPRGWELSLRQLGVDEAGRLLLVVDTSDEVSLGTVRALPSDARPVVTALAVVDPVRGVVEGRRLEASRPLPEFSAVAQWEHLGLRFEKVTHVDSRDPGAGITVSGADWTWTIPAFDAHVSACATFGARWAVLSAQDGKDGARRLVATWLDARGTIVREVVVERRRDAGDAGRLAQIACDASSATILGWAGGEVSVGDQRLERPRSSARAFFLDVTAGEASLRELPDAVALVPDGAVAPGDPFVLQVIYPATELDKGTWLIAADGTYTPLTPSLTPYAIQRGPGGVLAIAGRDEHADGTQVIVLK